MIPILLVLAHLAVVAGPAAALVMPRWRPAVVRGLLALGTAAILIAPFSGVDGRRQLDVVHSFAAFEGNQIAVHPFLVEQTTAPSWLWGAVVAAFCLLWAAVLRSLSPGRADALGWRRVGYGIRPFALPLLLAWSAIGLKLALEKAAAPAELVTPIGWERSLVPASLAAAILIGNRIRRIPLSILWLAVFVTCARVPLVLIGTFATRNEWGTSLDVHDTVQFANPFAQVAIDVAPKSTEQLAWLLWAPHLLVFPGLYMLSLAGVAFATVMIATHPADSQTPRMA